jgi:hypothetical protein
VVGEIMKVFRWSDIPKPAQRAKGSKTLAQRAKEHAVSREESRRDYKKFKAAKQPTEGQLERIALINAAASAAEASDRIPEKFTGVEQDHVANWLNANFPNGWSEADYNAVAYFGDPEPRCRRCGGRIPREFRDSQAFCEQCIRDPRVRASARNFTILTDGIVN